LHYRNIHSTTTYTDYKSLCEQKDIVIESLQQQISLQQLQIAELQKFIFSGRQEKFKADANSHALQAVLFNNDKLGEVVTASIKKVEGYQKITTAVRVNHPGRKPLEAHLRREVIYLIPTEEVSGLKPVGEEVTEVLEYQPGELFVKKYVRPEYIKPGEDGTNAVRVIAPLPSMPIDKAIAGPSLLAHLMVSKFVDHLPIYRQLQIFTRQKVNIDYTTTSNWIKQGCRLITPLFEAHYRQVLSASYLSADETPIKVIDKAKKGTTHQGYYWVYYDTVNRLVMFQYQTGRAAQWPTETLKDYQGYLQTDGYAGYEQFDKITGITTLNCWAHARRKFFDAQDYDKQKATAVLEQVQYLYKIESHCQDNHYTPEQIKHYRQEHSIPALASLHILLKSQMNETLPQSPMGKALQYTLARWDKLCVYTQDGRLRIDNNLIENSIRPVALGRKNYLFAGSHEAAQHGAMLYSLFATCRLYNINPVEWLTEVFSKIKDHSINKIHELLPQNYIK
jgi:transposase